jgi:hypothetical protein
MDRRPYLSVHGFDTRTVKCEPRRVLSERGRILGVWDLGPSDAHGWVSQAALYLRRRANPGATIVALTVRRERATGNHIDVWFQVSAPARTLIAAVPRWHQRVFRRQWEQSLWRAAVTTLRERIGHDPDLGAYFDPASDLHLGR